VFEAAGAGRQVRAVARDGFTWDAGPSLLTMPWVFEALFADTGAPLAEELELLPWSP
jgi:phytoene dehydrogenase-like protein